MDASLTQPVSILEMFNSYQYESVDTIGTAIPESMEHVGDSICSPLAHHGQRGKTKIQNYVTV